MAAAERAVETPGVRLERRGRYDVLVEAKGRCPAGPATLHPVHQDLVADCPSALAFSEGSVALDNELSPPFARSAERRRGCRSTQRRPRLGKPTRVTFRDARVQSSTAAAESRGDRRAGGAMCLVGSARPGRARLSTIFDPGLPAWIRDSLAHSTREILGRYADALGPAPTTRPLVMVSWAGPTPHKVNMGGSVLPGLIVMTFEGEGVVTEHPALRNQARWFVAHEAAHFWLGEAVRYEHSRDAWITEGGATSSLSAPSRRSTRLMIGARSAFLDADCAKLSQGRGVASAEQRNEHRAYYACAPSSPWSRRPPRRRASRRGSTR